MDGVYQPRCEARYAVVTRYSFRPMRDISKIGWLGKASLRSFKQRLEWNQGGSNAKDLGGAFQEEGTVSANLWGKKRHAWQGRPKRCVWLWLGGQGKKGGDEFREDTVLWATVKNMSFNFYGKSQKCFEQESSVIWFTLWYNITLSNVMANKMWAGSLGGYHSTFCKRWMMARWNGD